MHFTIRDIELSRLTKAVEKLKKDGLIKNQAQIAEDLGYKRVQTISDLITGVTPLTTKFVKAFCMKYDVNEDWLITGVGRFYFIGDAEIKESKPKEVIALGKNPNMRLKPEDYAAAYGDWPGLPMYNVPITASFIETYRDEKAIHPQYYLHDPRFKDCNFGAIITGDSMHSEIRHGDFVVCKEIEDRRFIVYGDIYYVVASNGLETCKYINADVNPENVLLVPRNESISSSPIPKEMIDRLYKVKGIVRGY